MGVKSTCSLAVFVAALAILGSVRPAPAQDFPPQDPLAIRMPDDAQGVWVTVSNEGASLDPAAARHLFEPFTQGESGPTRSHEGLGMGLYVVRRLAEVYGGEVSVRADGGWVTVELRLQPADDRRRPRPPQEPTALPMAKVTSAAAPPSTS